jgi:hypothetical protein
VLLTIREEILPHKEGKRRKKLATAIDIAGGIQNLGESSLKYARCELFEETNILLKIFSYENSGFIHIFSS